MFILDEKLVEAVATLLCQKAATHPDFFAAVADAVAKQGYSIEARQQGIQGTHIVIVRS